MARKERALKLKSGLIDRIDKAEKKKADAEKAAEPEEVSPAQVISDLIREENIKIWNERSNPVLGHVVDYLGQKTAVVDPNATWAMETPVALRSPKNMILHHIFKPNIRKIFDIDTETWQLRGGVLNHGTVMEFNDDDVLLTEENRKEVRIFRSFKEFDDWVCDELMVEHIGYCYANPDGPKEIKIIAHNGANFDFVSIALSLRMDKNTGRYREVVVRMPDGTRKKVQINFRIDKFGDKASMIAYFGRGTNGEGRIRFADSLHSLNAPLSALGDKGATPEQFTNPLKWLRRHTSKITGQPFDLTERDVRPYLYVAHLRTLESFEGTGEISDVAYEALQLWKNSIDDLEYSQDDLIILANAMKRMAAKQRKMAAPLADLLGQDTVDSFHPMAYNTSSSSGFALSSGYYYESRLERKENGQIGLKKALQEQQKRKVYALVTERGKTRLLSAEEAKEEIASFTPIQKHGLVKKGQRVLIEDPVWTSAWDNRFARMTQNGSQTTNFMPIAERVKELDLNSAFPAAMRYGCRKKAVIDGYEHNGKIIGRSNGPVHINALLGFENTSYMQSMPTQVMHKYGVATAEVMTNEHGQQVTMWVVRGRQKILHFLQFRSGSLMCVLPPSANAELHEIPGIPIRTPGRGLDSRLINPKLTQPTLLLLRAEYVAAYACSPTLDDDCMVIYLAEVSEVNGKPKVRDRSRHGPIQGVSVDEGKINPANAGEVFGVPHMPHAKMMGMMFTTRSHEKNLAEEAFRAGFLKKHGLHLADSKATKDLMNGGAYGSYGQSNRPERDFCLDDIEECIRECEALAGQDIAWTGMSEAVVLLAPDIAEASDMSSWRELFMAISAFKVQSDKIKKEGDPDSILARLRVHRNAFKTLYTSWAFHQISSFSTYMHRTPLTDENGDPIYQMRGIITSTEETTSHAQRQYSSAIVAKNAVNLHEAQLIVHRGPFALAYSDTDSIKAQTGKIKPYDLPQAVEFVRTEYLKAYGEEFADNVQGLERLMNDDAVDTDHIFVTILRMYGMKIGKQLGEWGLEKPTYTKGLVNPVKAGKPYISHTTYFFASKLYVDLDADNNVAVAKIRSIPKVNPMHGPVFIGFITSIPGLADRRGLDQENFRHVELNGSLEIKFGNRKRSVPMMLSNPRRIYTSTGGSEPFALELSDDMAAMILKGSYIPPERIASDVMRKIGVDEELKNIKGLTDAYLLYRKHAIINGRPFEQVAKEVRQEIQEKTHLINTQRLRRDSQPVMQSVFLSPEEGDELETLDAAFYDLRDQIQQGTSL